MKRQTQITVDLGDLTARTGEYQMIFRCEAGDKQDLDKAADNLKMSTAQFIRMVAIQAARKVLAEVA